MSDGNGVFQLNSTALFKVTEMEPLKAAKVDLDSIMDGKVDEMAVDDVEKEPINVDGYCVECSDQPAVVFCEQCMDGTTKVT